MIVIINPNSTVSMTDAMVVTAKQAAPHAVIEGWTSHDGPASIQGPQDGEASIPPLLKLVRKACDRGASAVIIGCFDDTGLAEARRIATCPVIGIGQAAYHAAVLYGDRFSVVTTLDVSVPILEENIKAHGFAQQLRRVRASGVEVLALETDADAPKQVVAEIRRSAAEDNVHSVVLGCAGMVSIPQEFAGESPVFLIDGVKSATLICVNLLALA